jgi:hypothetical protein
MEEIEYYTGLTSGKDLSTQQPDCFGITEANARYECTQTYISCLSMS